MSEVFTDWDRLVLYHAVMFRLNHLKHRAFASYLPYEQAKWQTMILARELARLQNHACLNIQPDYIKTLLDSLAAFQDNARHHDRGVVNCCGFTSYYEPALFSGVRSKLEHFSRNGKD